MADKKPRTVEINIDDLKPVKNTKLTLDELPVKHLRQSRRSRRPIRSCASGWLPRGRRDWDAPF